MTAAIAFFDVDFTLLHGNSGYYASLHLIKHKLLKKRRVVQAIYYSLAGLVLDQDVKKIYQIAVSDMAGTTLEHILEIGKTCFEKDLKPRLFKEGFEKIKEHQNKGDLVILLTAGPDMVMHWMKDHYKVNEVYSTGPHVENGLLTSQVRTPICHGPGKLHYAEKACRQYGINLKDCYFYSDHHTDIPLLEKVGKPRIVNPFRRLKNEAIKRNWPILQFK